MVRMLTATLLLHRQRLLSFSVRRRRRRFACRPRLSPRGWRRVRFDLRRTDTYHWSSKQHTHTHTHIVREREEGRRARCLPLQLFRRFVAVVTRRGGHT